MLTSKGWVWEPIDIKVDGGHGGHCWLEVEGRLRKGFDELRFLIHQFLEACVSRWSLSS